MLFHAGMTHSDLAEFQEIAHCGGRITFNLTTRPDDHARLISFGFEQRRPTPASIFAVWALPPGLPLTPYRLELGMGVQHEPPCAGAIPIYVGSDSHGMFGYECPRCRGYWRSRGVGSVCPYCRLHAERQHFLTAAQRRYLEHCCSEFERIMNGPDGEHFIDMDAAADAATRGDRPSFYYAGEAQQTRFACAACDTSLDVLGELAFCSSCGTFNGVERAEQKIARARAELNSGSATPPAVLREAVSVFDSIASKYAEHLCSVVPLSKRRRAALEGRRFHDIDRVSQALRDAFDIEILQGMAPEVRLELKIMFERRHVHEHKGGAVDDVYIQSTGDTSVRLGQMLREDKDRVHRFLSSVSRVLNKLHEGFHDLLPPLAEPIRLKRRGEEFRRPRD